MTVGFGYAVEGHMSSTFPRRRFLTGIGVGAGASALAATAATPAAAGSRPPAEQSAGDTPVAAQIVPFDGPHQAGIDTQSQAVAWVIAFDVKEGAGREQMRRLMRTWTEDARRMSRGEPSITELEPEMVDKPANLSFTVGFGEGFFEAIDRRDQKPDWLGPLPAYSRDRLEERWSGGDVMLQVCCDDPMTLSHATRYMIRNAGTYLDLRWIQDGFLNANGTRAPGETPRNRFGQLDGTVNPRTEEEFDEIVWIDSGPEWLRGGTSMVIRRIDMLIDLWELLDRTGREEVVGRTLDTGAPLGKEKEHDPADLELRDEFGLPVVDPKSHMARSMPADGKPGLQIRRRVYQYDHPPQPGSAESEDTGLMFICFQKDPLEQFDPIQRRLDEEDRLNEWIVHIGSAVFAIPGGTREDEYWAQSLLEG